MSKELINKEYGIEELEEIWMGRCMSCLRKYDLWVNNENLKYKKGE